MDARAYLDRFGYNQSLDPSIEVLRVLQRAHLLHIPFENLDIGLGRVIRLEPDALFEKIVTHRRGGFCYELNGLFSRLLNALGFRVQLLDARGVNDDGSLSRDFDHMALRVWIPASPTSGEDDSGSWLVDVGWGNGPFEPLNLEDAGEQRQGERLFRLEADPGYSAQNAGDETFVLSEQVTQADGSPAWIRHYAFTLKPYDYADYYDCCRYHQTSPESMFTQKRLVTRFLLDGRVTLSDMRLIITQDGTRNEQILADEGAYQQALRSYFGIEL